MAEIEVFYSDPVDNDGNAVGTSGPMTVTTPRGSFMATKIPHDEIVLDAKTTIRARPKAA